MLPKLRKNDANYGKMLRKLRDNVHHIVLRQLCPFEIEKKTVELLRPAQKRKHKI